MHESIVLLLAWSCGAYLVGSFPSGYLIARSAGIDDITRRGSGTMGATNVARSLGIRFFFIVFLIDACKAAALLYCMPAYARPLGIIMLMMGNTLSAFFSFSGGGKGVATLVGILCVLDLKLTLLFIAVWLLSLIGIRSVGIASSIALVLLVPGAFFLMPDPLVACRIMFAALWSLYMHKKHVAVLYQRAFV